MKNLDPALEMKIQDIKDLIYRLPEVTSAGP